eukprot:7780470-Karenia_brevis.AAC.1
MAFQPHTQQCKNRFEELLKEDAKVRNQQARMKEFEERERLSKERKEKRKEESRGDGDTQDKKRKTETVVGEGGKDSGGSSSSN